MASRREQKDRLRKEREAREAAARASKGRQRLVGYAVGGGVVLVVAIVAIVLLAGGGGSGASADVLPDGGDVPEIAEVDTVEEGAEAGNCELESFRAKSREHLADLAQRVKYASDPPTSGNHYQVPAEDGAYEDPPDTKELVHTLEHGRVVIWFKPSLPSDARAALKAYFDDDSYQMVLVPDDTMKFQVAATAWNRDPQPNGTGRLLGCPKYDDQIFTALEAFKDEHRSRGPEPVP